MGAWREEVMVVKSVDLRGEFTPGLLVSKPILRPRSAPLSMQLQRSLGVSM
jgi:hypothetical protein